MEHLKIKQQKAFASHRNEWRIWYCILHRMTVDVQPKWNADTGKWMFMFVRWFLQFPLLHWDARVLRHYSLFLNQALSWFISENTLIRACSADSGFPSTQISMWRWVAECVANADQHTSLQYHGCHEEPKITAVSSVQFMHIYYYDRYINFAMAIKLDTMLPRWIVAPPFHSVWYGLSHRMQASNCPSNFLPYMCYVNIYPGNISKVIWCTLPTTAAHHKKRDAPFATITKQIGWNEMVASKKCGRACLQSPRRKTDVQHLEEKKHLYIGGETLYALTFLLR